MRVQPSSGFTLSEVLTVLVVLVVLIAIAIPMWRTHELRVRRDDAMNSLLAMQKAQDQYFGRFARYANETQLATNPTTGTGITAKSKRGYYRIEVRVSADGLGYWASAHPVPIDGLPADMRCVELRIDQNGRKFAVDADGVDRSADCWR
jgi:type IV pilus assembly protein PilE